MTVQWRNTFFHVNRTGIVSFRVSGYGLWLGRYSTWPALFSERYGYEKVWRISVDWRIRVLVPR